MPLLLVHFLPRGERSRTKRLLRAFDGELGMGNTTAETLDLAAHPPLAFNRGSLRAYTRRNYGDELLSGDEAATLAEADRLTDQLKRADTVVLAYPMYNFSVPAAVKAWLDAVMQKGQTWTKTEGVARGLLASPRGLILTTSGNAYSGTFRDWDHATPLVRH